MKQKVKQKTAVMVDTIAKSGAQLSLAGFAAYGVRSLYNNMAGTSAEETVGYILTGVTVLALLYIAHKK